MRPFFERLAAAGRLAGTWPGARLTWASSRLSSSSSSSSSSPAAAAEKEEDGKRGLFSSWIGKVKGVFQSNSQLDFEEQASAVDPSVKLTPDYSFLECADELRKVRRLGKVTNLLNVTKKADLEVLEKYEQVLRALAKQDPTGKCLDAQQRATAAKEYGCSIAQINEALAKFEWMKETRNNVLQKVLQSRSRGEGLPKTMEEVKKLFEESNALKWSPPRGASLYRRETKSPDVGRNCPCTCGSGKKYKRCCGRES